VSVRRTRYAVLTQILRGEFILSVSKNSPSHNEGAFFVDAAHGSDTATGTMVDPFATPARALAATRAAGSGNGGGRIVLRDSAPFHITAPLALGPADSGLTISAFPGEAPVLSGGAPLGKLAWTRVGPSPTTNEATVWSADISAVPELRVPFSSLFGPDGRRATRARYPNGDSERLLVPNGCVHSPITIFFLQKATRLGSSHSVQSCSTVLCSLLRSNRNHHYFFNLHFF
jgi:hypothetical protein